MQEALSMTVNTYGMAESNSEGGGQNGRKTALAYKRVDVPLVDFMYLVFTRMPGESYGRGLGYLFVVFVWCLSSAD